MIGLHTQNFALPDFCHWFDQPSQGKTARTGDMTEPNRHRKSTRKSMPAEVEMSLMSHQGNESRRGSYSADNRLDSAQGCVSLRIVQKTALNRREPSAMRCNDKAQDSGNKRGVTTNG